MRLLRLLSNSFLTFKLYDACQSWPRQLLLDLIVVSSLSLSKKYKVPQFNHYNFENKTKQFPKFHLAGLFEDIISIPESEKVLR